MNARNVRSAHSKDARGPRQRRKRQRDAKRAIKARQDRPHLIERRTLMISGVPQGKASQVRVVCWRLVRRWKPATDSAGTMTVETREDCSGQGEQGLEDSVQLRWTLTGRSTDAHVYICWFLWPKVSRNSGAHYSNCDGRGSVLNGIANYRCQCQN